MPSAALVDVDGVLAGFTPHVLARATKGRLSPKDITTWDIFGFMDKMERGTAIKACNGYDVWADLPVIEGAQEGVEMLRSRFGRVRFATSPWWGCDKWTNIRADWLKKHFDANRRDVIIGPEKNLLRGSIFIDDKPAHIEAWTAANAADYDGWPPAVIFDATYNKSCAAPYRLRGWADLPRVLEEMGHE